MLTKSQARAFFLGGTGVFSLAFLALTYDSHKQVPQLTHEENLTKQVVAGKMIWENNNCMGCHTLFGEGAYYAPELTKVLERRGETWLRVFLKDPQAMFPGERQMVNYHFNDTQIDELLAFLTWCGNVNLNGFPAKPPLGRIAAPPVAPVSVKQPELFTTASCVGCHSVGGIGGTIGPALDTVGARLGRKGIIDQITNPRAVEPGKIQMPKLPLSPENVNALADYLMSVSANN